MTSSYTGHVTVGGPSQTRVVGGLEITKVAVGPMDNNAYLLRCLDNDERLLIDAADEADTLLALPGGTSLTKVVTTHRHHDHWQALEGVVRATSAETYAGEFDAAAIEVPTDVQVRDGDGIMIGNCALEAIHLRGHTPGSIVVHFDAGDDGHHLFTGDCLFPGGVGKTSSEEDFESLYAGVVGKLFDRFPDAHVYPGHGDDTTLAAERPQLQEWRERGW